MLYVKTSIYALNGRIASEVKLELRDCNWIYCSTDVFELVNQCIVSGVY